MPSLLLLLLLLLLSFICIFLKCIRFCFVSASFFLLFICPDPKPRPEESRFDRVIDGGPYFAMKYAVMSRVRRHSRRIPYRFETDATHSIVHLLLHQWPWNETMITKQKSLSLSLPYSLMHPTQSISIDGYIDIYGARDMALPWNNERGAIFTASS